MQTTISVHPWPFYTDTGRGPFWPVRIESLKFHGWVTWGPSNDSFVANRELFRLRTQDVSAYRQALRFMTEFGQKAAKAKEL